MKILITGASGVIGRILTKALAPFHSLALIDQKSLSEIVDNDYRLIASKNKYIQLDISEYSALENEVKKFTPDTVIHLAAILGRTTSWNQILHSNIIGAINLFEASNTAMVKRIIYTSSNNVYGGYEIEAQKTGMPLHLLEHPNMLDENVLAKPDTRYAVAKLMIENYAVYLSSSSPISMIGLRIGTVREVDNPELQTSEPEFIARFRTTWLYHHDLIQLIDLCLHAKIKTGIYNAISGLPGSFGIFIDIGKAINELGYTPKGKSLFGKEDKNEK